MLTLTAFAVLGFTEPDPAVPCTARRPPDDDDDFEEVTVYRGLKSTKPNEIRVDDDGFSTYEILVPRPEYKHVLAFRVRYKKPKTPGTVGTIMNSPIPGMTATYTPGLGFPAYGEGHWSLNGPAGMTQQQFKDILVQYMKSQFAK